MDTKENKRKVISLVTKTEQEVRDILNTIVQEDTILVVTKDDNDDLTIYSFRSATPLQIIGILDEAKHAFRSWWWDYKDTHVEGEPI